MCIIKKSTIHGWRIGSSRSCCEHCCWHETRKPQCFSRPGLPTGGRILIIRIATSRIHGVGLSKNVDGYAFNRSLNGYIWQRNKKNRCDTLTLPFVCWGCNVETLAKIRQGKFSFPLHKKWKPFSPNESRNKIKINLIAFLGKKLVPVRQSIVININKSTQSLNL